MVAGRGISGFTVFCSGTLHVCGEGYANIVQCRRTGGGVGRLGQNSIYPCRVEVNSEHLSPAYLGD